MKINKIILIAVIVLASFLRLYKLGSVPVHLTPDEAAIGYSAYSILKTGKDEHGAVLPVVFQSFGDNKPGLYIYLSIPFIGVMGLNEYSVRLLSAVSGIVAVFLIYCIAESFQKHKSNKKIFWNLGLISSFLLAICPWHIYFSRGAWEANLAFTLTLLGIYFFLRVKDNALYLLVSSVFFALTFLTYQGAKLATPLILLVLVLEYKKTLHAVSKKVLLSSVILSLLIVFPIIISVVSGNAGRLAVFSVFSSRRPDDLLTRFLGEGGEKVGDLRYYVFHSEFYNYTRGIFGRFLNHFSPRFLFFEGDWQNPRHSAVYYGMLHTFDLFLLPFGLVSLAVLRKNKMARIIFLWLLLAPVPAALSRDEVHAVRSIPMLLPLVLASSAGVSFALQKVRFKRLAVSVLAVVFALNMAYFLDLYFVHTAKLRSQHWEYGYKQIAETVIPIQNNYETVYVQQDYSQPYIYFLFYGAKNKYAQYEPSNIQPQLKYQFFSSLVGDVGEVKKIENISFGRVDWPALRDEPNLLLVGDEKSIPSTTTPDARDYRLISEIYYLDEKFVAFRIIETQGK